MNVFVILLYFLVPNNDNNLVSGFHLLRATKTTTTRSSYYDNIITTQLDDGVPMKTTTALNLASSSSDGNNVPTQISSLDWKSQVWPASLEVLACGSICINSLFRLINHIVTEYETYEWLKTDAVILLLFVYLFNDTLNQVDYDLLEDIDQNNSLARQASIWSCTENKIPVTYKSATDQTYKVATFAGGNFWATELCFQRIPGVIATCVGYTKGDDDDASSTDNAKVEEEEPSQKKQQPEWFKRIFGDERKKLQPLWDKVKTGETEYTEAVQILYNPSRCSYRRLVTIFLDTLGNDITSLNKVGNDIGTHYRHGIYYHTNQQEEDASEILQEKQKKLFQNHSYGIKTRNIILACRTLSSTLFTKKRTIR